MIAIKYVCCGCNQLPHASDWGNNNLICYASNFAIIIFDPHINRFGSVLSTLCRHKDRVNVVRWIRNFSSTLETEMISASADGTAVIWKANVLKKNGSFQALDVLETNASITLCDATYVSKNSTDLLITTYNTKGLLSIWLRRNGITKVKQKLYFFNKIVTEMKLSILPTGSDVFTSLLIVAMQDCKIYLYSSNHNNSQVSFKK